MSIQKANAVKNNINFNYWKKKSDEDFFGNSSLLNQQILDVILSFAATVDLLGHKVVPFSKTAWKVLNQLTEDQKKQVISHFTNWNKMYSDIILSEPNAEPTEEDILKKEKRNEYFLRRALDKLGFYVDNDFWKTLENDHVVEIYGEHMIQLYRSLNFFDTCGYSIPDLAAHEWYQLWERPAKIMEELIKGSNEVVSKGLTTFKPNIPKHLIKEILNTTATEPFIPRAMLVDFVSVACLRDKKTHQPMGLVLTSKVSMVALGQNATDDILNF